LKSGHVPLWNPYQFCGEPFLAIGYAGVLYPPHLIMLFVDALTSNEILFVFHMFLAALGMWLLMRHLGVGLLGGPHRVGHVCVVGVDDPQQQPAVGLGRNELDPAHHAAHRSGRARRTVRVLGLTLALACQLLLGIVEISVHTLYLGALFTVCRLAQLAWQGAWRTALQRGALSLVCVGAAALLVMPQLLPAVELAQQSTRGAGALSFAQVLQFGGSIPPLVFARAALETAGAVTVGALPVLAAPLALGCEGNA